MNPLMLEKLKDYGKQVPRLLDTIPFSFEKVVNKFMERRGEQKVLLLSGDAFSGKSTYCYLLYHRLWQYYAEQEFVIPLYISLSTITNPGTQLIEESLTQQGLTAQEISDFKQQARFLFMIDGYEELGRFQNLYVSNHLEQWNCQVIITCRHLFLAQEEDYQAYFTPYVQEQAQDHLLTEITSTALNAESIDDYLLSYTTQSSNLGEKNLRVLDTFPFLQSFAQSPFFLRIISKELPTWDKKFRETSDYQQIQQACYQVLLQQWFEAHAAKCKAFKTEKEGSSLTLLFLEYVKTLAHQMTLQGLTDIKYEKPSALSEEISPWQQFFNGDNEPIRLAFQACPWRAVGQDHYAFMENELQNYLVSLPMDMSLSKQLFHLKTNETDELPSINKKMPIEAIRQRAVNKIEQHSLNQTLYTRDAIKIGLWADGIRRNDAQSELLKEKLFAFIEGSKGNPLLSKAAANAITILNYGNISFAGLDLSGIKIPTADLENAILHRTDLRKADLNGVNFENAFLHQALLKNAQLKNIEFGIRPFLEVGNEVITMIPLDYRFLIVGTQKGSLDIWNLDKQKKQQLYKSTTSICCLAVAYHDNILIAVGCLDGVILIGEVKITRKGGEEHFKLTVLESQKSQSEIAHIGFQYKDVFAVDKNNKFFAWMYDDAEKHHIFMNRIVGRLRKSRHITFKQASSLPEKKQLIVVMQSENNEQQIEEVVTIWSLIPHKLLNCFVPIASDQEKRILDKAFIFPHGASLILVWDKKDLQVWDIQTAIGSKLILDYHAAEITDIVFSKDGHYFASASDDKTICLWSVNVHPVLLKRYSHHRASVNVVCFSKDGQWLYSGGKEGLVRIEKVKINSIYDNVVASGHVLGVAGFAFFSQRSIIASIGRDNTICFWNVSKKVLNYRFALIQPYTNTFLSSLASDPRGDYFVLGSTRGSIYFGNYNTKNILNKSLQGHSACVTGLCLGAQVLAASSLDGKIRLWEVKYHEESWYVNEKKTIVLRGHTGIVNISLSPSEQVLASSGEDGSVRLWEIASGELLAYYNSNAGAVFGLAFPPNERWIAFSDSYGIHIWEWRTAEPVYVLTAGTKALNLNFSPDNCLLACGHEDGRITLWNTSDWQCLETIQAHRGKVIVTFSSSETLFSGGEDGAIRIWQVKPKGCLLLQKTEQHELFLKDAILGEEIDSLPLSIIKILKQEEACIGEKNSVQSLPTAYITNDMPQWLRKEISVDRQLRWDPVLIATIQLLQAVKEKQLEEVVSCLKIGADVCEIDEEGNTALHIALQNKDFKIMQVLLEYKANPMIINYANLSCLKLAIRTGESILVDSILAFYSRFVSNNVKEMNEALLLASSLGFLSIVKLLLQAGAQVQFVDDNGWNALHISALYNHHQLIKELVAVGINLEAPNSEGATPLLIAAREGHFESLTVLIQVGSKINQRDKLGQTALIKAALYNRPIIVRELLRLKAEIEAADLSGATSLLCAAYEGSCTFSSCTQSKLS